MLKMTKCARICGAYSCRLRRRYPTLLLIAFFIITLLIILQLYAYKHQNRPHAPPRIGDFDYRPGCFLKGQQPNENKTYCEFNYGLPYELRWSSIQSHPTPEMGSKSHYKVIYNAIKGRAFANYSQYDAVTYVTQATPEFVYHVVEIARYWEGPISLAVFVPSYDLDITMQIMNHLCSCYPGMSKVSLHLFFPKKYLPIIVKKEQMKVSSTEIPTTTTNITVEQLLRKKLENYRRLNNKTRAEYIQRARKRKIENMVMKMPKKRIVVPDLKFTDCSGLESLNIRTFRRDKNVLYPINVGRNVARNGTNTNYFLVSDIEMVPSDGLAPQFLSMVRKLMGDKKRDEGCVFANTVFVVPLFEVERGEEIPRDKDMLVRLVVDNRAAYFHQKICSHCQRFPGLQSWLLRESPKAIEPMLIARREYPYHRWEPLYFGTHKEPWYSETLSWEGRQDKMTQMLELCLLKYRMVVLDGGFLCHAAAQKTGNRYNRAERMNAQRYTKIIRALKKKYPDIPQCRVTWGCRK